MLKLAVPGDEKRIDEFCRPFALGIRVRCLTSAYGLSGSLVSVWLGEENGEITAAVSLFDGAATVLASDNADFSELSHFLRGLSFSSLCGEEETFFNNSKFAVENSEFRIRSTVIEKTKLYIYLIFKK